MIAKESEKRPWGRFLVIHDEPTYKLKRIEVDPGGRLSYQYHNKRSEAWTIVYGVGCITLDAIEKDYSKGETILIPQGVKHRIEHHPLSTLLPNHDHISRYRDSGRTFRQPPSRTQTRSHCL